MLVHIKWYTCAVSAAYRFFPSRCFTNFQKCPWAPIKCSSVENSEQYQSSTQNVSQHQECRYLHQIKRLWVSMSTIFFPWFPYPEQLTKVLHSLYQKQVHRYLLKQCLHGYLSVCLYFCMSVYEQWEEHIWWRWTTGIYNASLFRLAHMSMCIRSIPFYCAYENSYA